MNIRQAVVFSILMAHNQGVLMKSSKYILEKVEVCGELRVPEVILDREGRGIFGEYGRKWGFDWNTERDEKIPLTGKFNSVTGEMTEVKSKTDG